MGVTFFLFQAPEFFDFSLFPCFFFFFLLPFFPCVVRETLATQHSGGISGCFYNSDCTFCLLAPYLDSVPLGSQSRFIFAIFFVLDPPRAVSGAGPRDRCTRVSADLGSGPIPVLSLPPQWPFRMFVRHRRRFAERLLSPFPQAVLFFPFCSSCRFNFPY